MREEDIEYARGCAMMADGVPDALVQQAARLAPRTEAAALFGPGEFQRDGWAIDPAGKVWTPPDRDTPFDPVRPSTARAEVASGISSTAVPSSSRPTQTVDLGKQLAAAAQLTDPELAQMIEESDRWERWCSDPRLWRWRWDRRVLYLGRALRGGKGAPGSLDTMKLKPI